VVEVVLFNSGWSNLRSSG